MAVSTDSTVVPNGVHSTTGATNSRPLQVTPKPTLDIIDIRSAAVELNLKDEITGLIKPKDGPRRMPTLLLYNERGLQLFEQVLLPSGASIS